jgi:hypothetical protein
MTGKSEAGRGWQGKLAAIFGGRRAEELKNRHVEWRRVIFAALGRNFRGTSGLRAVEW